MSAFSLQSKVVRADAASVRLAAEALHAGGLVVFPTDTVYGIAVDPLNPEAVASIYRIKGRDAGKPLQVILAAAAQLADVAEDVSPEARRLAERFFPGGITLVLKKAKSVPSTVVAGGETVGVRVPDHPVCHDLVRAFGRPIAATSANRSGQPSPRTAQEAMAQVGEDVTIVLDAGPCPLGIDSTVIDLSTDKPRILRIGAVPVPEIERLLGVNLTALA